MSLDLLPASPGFSCKGPGKEIKGNILLMGKKQKKEYSSCYILYYS